MFKKIRKIIPIMLTVALASSVMTGCSSSQTEEEVGTGEAVELKLWTISLKPKFDPYFNALIKDYEAQNPNVKIVWEDMPQDVMQQKLLTSIASDQAPDVVNLNTEYALQMAGKDALVNFEEELSQEEKSIYFDGLYNSASNGKGGIYGLPWYTGAPVLFMNKEIIEQAGLDINNPPKTQDEVFEWSKIIKEKTGKYGISTGSDASELVGEGIELLNEDKTKAAFNTQETKDYLKKKKGYFDSQIVPKQKKDFNLEVQNIASESTAMIISNGTFLNNISTSAPDVYKKLVVAPAPTGSASKTFASTMNIAVPKASKNKDEAVKFAKFLTNAKNQTQFSKEANTMPSTKESIKDEYFTKNDGTIESQTMLESLKTLETVTDFSIGVERASDIRLEINKAMENVNLNGKDIDSELKAAEDRVNQILSEINK